MEFLLTTLLSLAAIVIGYVTYRAQVAPGLKRLHYTSVAFDLILPIVHDDLRKLFKVFLRGQELINPVVCAVRIKSTGKAPIRPDDFNAPLTIEAAEEDVIFRGGIMECNPPNIFNGDKDISDKAPFSVKLNKFMIRPVLLNPGDEFELAYIADMLPEKWDLSVNCRIAGLKQVARVPRLADGLIQELYAEPINLPGSGDPFKPRLERLFFYVWIAPILANLGEKFGDSLELKIGNRIIENPHLLYVIISNDRKEAAADSGPGIISVDIPGARIARLIARQTDSSEQERDGSSFVKKVNEHKITIQIPKLNSGDSIRASAITSGVCLEPIIESHNLLVDEAVMLQLRGGDLIDKNLARMDPEILLSNRKLYLHWQRLRARHEWRTRHGRN